MGNKKFNDNFNPEVMIPKIIKYLIVIIALIFFLNYSLELIDSNDHFYEDDKIGFIASSVVLISFIWYTFVINKRQ